MALGSALRPQNKVRYHRWKGFDSELVSDLIQKSFNQKIQKPNGHKWSRPYQCHINDS